MSDPDRLEPLDRKKDGADGFETAMNHVRVSLHPDQEPVLTGRLAAPSSDDGMGGSIVFQELSNLAGDETLGSLGLVVIHTNSFLKSSDVLLWREFTPTTSSILQFSPDLTRLWTFTKDSRIRVELVRRPTAPDVARQLGTPYEVVAGKSYAFDFPVRGEAALPPSSAPATGTDSDKLSGEVLVTHSKLIRDPREQFNAGVGQNGPRSSPKREPLSLRDEVLIDVVVIELLSAAREDPLAPPSDNGSKRLVERIVGSAGMSMTEFLGIARGPDSEAGLREIVRSVFAESPDDSKLPPRVTSRRQRVLYPVIDDASAQRFAESDESVRRRMLEERAEFSGSGEAIDLEPVLELARTLRELRDSGGYLKELPKRSAEGGRFESEAVPETHRILSSLSKEALCDRAFWRWIAVHYFSDVIDWRFKSDGGSALIGNYGVGNGGHENMLYRLWIRGEIGRDPDTGSYDLAVTGDQDLWRSHIIRQGYGNVRDVARALLQLQAGLLDCRPLRVREIREVAKRLKLLHDRECLELLNRVEAEDLILRIARSV